MKKLLTIACVCLLATAVGAMAQQDDARKAAAEVSQKAFEANRAKYAGGNDVMVKPGLLADRKAGTVKLWAVATSVGPDDPIEFLLIAADSGKDYEALAMTFAAIGDVNDALQFIGLKPGRAVDYTQRMYWARGEEVAMKVAWTDAQGKPHEQAVQALLRNPQTGKGWESRLVYTGSRWLTMPDGQKVWLAAVNDAAAVASTYSNAAGLLDVADRSPQGDVYGTIKPVEKMPIGAGQAVVVTLVRSGKSREMDVALSVKEAEGKMLVRVADEQATDWVGALAKFDQWVGEGRAPFVTVRWDDELKVSDAIKAAALLARIEGPEGIRIEPPVPVPGAEGRLYYRAFLPDPKWRDPAKRVFNGWDVALTQDGKITATERADVRDPATGEYSVAVQSHTAANAEDLAKLLAERDGERPRDVYVHVPDGMTCGRLQAALSHCLTHHPTVYVFID